MGRTKRVNNESASVPLASPVPFPLAKGRLICQAGTPDGLFFDPAGIQVDEVVTAHAHAKGAMVTFDGQTLAIAPNTQASFHPTSTFRIDTEGTVDVMVVPEVVSPEERAAALERLGPNYEAISRTVDKVFGPAKPQ